MSTDTTHDDDFHPATAGDDPIWMGGVEYITKSRSDDLVEAAEQRGYANAMEAERKLHDSRIEELEANLAEQIEWVKRLADDLIAAEGREARLKDKLAKALQVLKDMRDDKTGFRHEVHFRRRAAVVYAELTGGKDDTAR